MTQGLERVEQEEGKRFGNVIAAEVSNTISFLFVLHFFFSVESIQNVTSTLTVEGNVLKPQVSTAKSSPPPPPQPPALAIGNIQDNPQAAAAADGGGQNNDGNVESVLDVAYR